MWVLLESVFLMILYSNEECALAILNSGLYMRQSYMYMTNCIKIVIPCLFLGQEDRGGLKFVG